MSLCTLYKCDLCGMAFGGDVDLFGFTIGIEPDGNVFILTPSCDLTSKHICKDCLDALHNYVESQDINPQI